VEGAGRERIFLYGTLRRGGSRDVLKHYGDVEFIGAARVRGVLHDFGEYPGLRLSDAEGWVKGELFDVTPAVLALLDEWEGIVPDATEQGEYRRIRMTVERDTREAESCWGYEIAPPNWEGRPVIASGDWTAHDAARG
jgi:gamma-glutamylcyclotransferase (GGCT)/AIG2-like uncharacterized protein YtfP